MHLPETVEVAIEKSDQSAKERIEFGFAGPDFDSSMSGLQSLTANSNAKFNASYYANINI